MSSMSIFQIAGSALVAQSQRLNVAASNLANADSAVGPDGQPYQARHVVFRVAPFPGQAAGSEVGGVQVVGVVQSNAAPRMVYDPTSPLANEEGYVAMPNVNVVNETVDMIAASRAYQANVDVLNTARTLMLKTLTIGQ